MTVMSDPINKGKLRLVDDTHGGNYRVNVTSEELEQDESLQFYEGDEDGE